MNLNDISLNIKNGEENDKSSEEILLEIKTILEEELASESLIKSLDEAISSLPEDFGWNDNSIETSNGNKVYFKNIQEQLINEIEQADIVLGAVAWLKCAKIIKALHKKKNVFIIVNKDELFKLDSSKLKPWQVKEKQRILKLYLDLNCELNPYQFNNLLNKVDEKHSLYIEPIKCFGQEKQNSSYSLMHNKFLLFAKIKKEEINIPIKDSYVEMVEPYAVWTGSFNLTRNATQSLENAVVVTDKSIINAYFKEFGQIAAASEKILWSSPTPNPDWSLA